MACHRFVRVLVASLLWLTCPLARAYFDPPWITPEQPLAGQVVSVNIHGGICDVIFNEPGYPRITQVGDTITIRFWGARRFDPLFCIFGVGTAVRPLGAYPPGTYTLIVELEYEIRTAPYVLVDVIGSVPFTVRGGGSEPVAVPTASRWGLPGAAVLLMLAALVALRRRGVLVLLALIALPAGVRAQDEPSVASTIHVLTTTPAIAGAVVAWYRATPPIGLPPLPGLTAGEPMFATWLLPQRAEGDALARLRNHPDSARAMLERMLVVRYPERTDLHAALAALRADPLVLSATIPMQTTPSSVELQDYGIGDGWPDGSGDYGRAALNIDAAWAITGGHALVAVVDTGLRTQHAALRQFAVDGTWLGGNFVEGLSADISLTGIVASPQHSPDVDERRPMPVSDLACNPDPNNQPPLPPEIAGHGTHVAGLVAGKGLSGSTAFGTCAHCGIAMWKTNYVKCDPNDAESILYSSPAAEDAAVTHAGDYGAQVINMSFGAIEFGPRTMPYCTQYPTDSLCLAMAVSHARDIAMVASAGNWRRPLQFPAMSTEYVIPAGGFQQDFALWDLSPGGSANCPYPSVGGNPECGSCYTKYGQYAGSTFFPEQELVASANTVLSTTYPGYDWNTTVHCGDSYGTPLGDGVGLCTGTSMSAPQISGVVALLRSLNPLVPTGSPATPGTLRHVLATTTAQAQLGQGWEPRIGYGLPDAAAAAQAMLGDVGNRPARNRATPLFRLYSTGVTDYVDTTVPQLAVGLQTSQKHAWHVVAGLPGVPGYAQFPHDPADGSIDAPGASIYVLAIEARVRNDWPVPVPLHLMRKPTPNMGLPPRPADFLLTTNATEIEQAHAQGYRLTTIQGYVYAPCQDEPDCMPPGTQTLWRAYRTTHADCAVFLDGEKTAFQSTGYTANCPGTATQKIGYAYPAISPGAPDPDTDNDGLPDAFEYVAGTNPDFADSDGDGQSDAAEYPMVGVPLSDPCADGAYDAHRCFGDSIFRNGFEAV